jgi:hypothetical protein
MEPANVHKPEIATTVFEMGPLSKQTLREINVPETVPPRPSDGWSVRFGPAVRREFKCALGSGRCSRTDRPKVLVTRSLPKSPELHFPLRRKRASAWHLRLADCETVSI